MRTDLNQKIGYNYNMKINYITLKRGEILNCSKTNPRYILILGFYIGVLETVLDIMDRNYDLAKDLLSQIIVDHMPEHKGLLNKIDYTQFLSGEFSNKLSCIYKAMLSLWMSMQEELLPYAEELDYKEVKKQLLDIHSALMELYQLTIS